MVASSELAAQVGGSSGENEGDKDPLSVFTAYDVEAQARGALVQNHFPGFPVQTVQIKHQIGGFGGPQHLPELESERRAKITMRRNLPWSSPLAKAKNVRAPQGDGALLRMAWPKFSSEGERNLFTHTLYFCLSHSCPHIEMHAEVTVQTQWEKWSYWIPPVWLFLTVTGKFRFSRSRWSTQL